MIADRTPVTGLLIMESHGLAPDTRSESFRSFSVWSKLYQLGPYYLDLILQPGATTLELRGELVSLDGHPLDLDGQVALQQQGLPLDSIPLTPNADFRLPVDHIGSYQLALELNGTSYTVPGLDMG